MQGHDLVTQSVLKFLEENFKSINFTIFQLAGDASARKYFRIILNEESFVLMVWEPFDETTYPFLDVLNHFQKSNVNVPKVIGQSGALGVILLEDLGDLTLERKFWESTNQEYSWAFYEKSLDQIISIHTTATESPNTSIAKKIEFDVAKFMWELNYAKENLIKGLLKFNFTEEKEAQLEKIFLDICKKLYAEPQVICHRDYHSRNLMIKLDKVCVIDFQDARKGPAQYDLVSLVKDSYVDISDSYGEKMLNYYLNKTNFLKNKNISSDHFYFIYEIQSIQRCFKACGSFASFMNQRQDKRYLKYLTPTLKKVMRSLGHFPEYKLLLDVLIDAGAFEKNYERL